MRIHVFHNVLWARYKGEIFSALWQAADPSEFAYRFTQIAETDARRAQLATVDLNCHRYPFELLFRGPYTDVPLYRRLVTVVRRTLASDADLVILSGYHRLECWLQLVILKLRRRKVAVFLDSTLRDKPQRALRAGLKRCFIRTVDGIFGYGLRTQQYALHLGAQAGNVFIPCQAAALPADYSAAVALQARCGVDTPPEAPRFLYVGRLSAEKGLDSLLEALARLHRSLPAATLTLVGEGPLREALEARARDLLPAGAVSFAGSKSGTELFAEYTRASALVLPSMSEPWGLVVNEALAYGCPVIVSDRCGCVPELVIEGETGLQHQAGNVEHLAEALALVPERFANRRLIGERCQAVISLYTPQRAAQEIIAGCRRLLAR